MPSVLNTFLGPLLVNRRKKNNGLMCSSIVSGSIALWKRKILKVTFTKGKTKRYLFTYFLVKAAGYSFLDHASPTKPNPWSLTAKMIIAMTNWTSHIFDQTNPMFN